MNFMYELQMIKDSINLTFKGQSSLQSKVCVGSSIDTLATVSPPYYQRKPSVLSVVSHESLIQKPLQNCHLLERKIFIKFLQAKNNSKHKQKYLGKIQSFYSHLPSTEYHQQGFILTPTLIIPDITVSNQNKEPLKYFINIWLSSMGYKSPQNKKYILEKAKIVLRIEMMSQAVGFYDEFGGRYLSVQERYKLAMETCQNGWQHFIQKLVETVRKFLKCPSNQ